jgi:hypothetical protein
MEQRIAHGDSALLAARHAPGRVKCAIEVTEHCAGVIEESTTSVRQLNTPRLPSKELYIHFLFDRFDLSAERRLLHAEPLRGARDVSFLGDSDEISEVPQFHCHTRIVWISL